MFELGLRRVNLPRWCIGAPPAPPLTLSGVFSAELIRSRPFVAASPAVGVHVINAPLTAGAGSKDLF